MRTFSVDFEAQKNARYARPFATFEFRFPPGTIRLAQYGKNVTIAANPHAPIVTDFGAFGPSLEERIVVSDIDETDLIVVNQPGKAGSPIAGYRFTQYWPASIGTVEVDVYLNFQVPLEGPIYQYKLTTMVAHSPTRYNLIDATIKLVSLHAKFFDREFLQEIDDERFPLASDEYMGRFFPIVIGDCPKVPLVRWDDNRKVFGLESPADLPVVSIGSRYWNGVKISETDIKIDFDQLNSSNFNLGVVPSVPPDGGAASPASVILEGAPAQDEKWQFAVNTGTHLRPTFTVLQKFRAHPPKVSVPSRVTSLESPVVPRGNPHALNVHVVPADGVSVDDALSGVNAPGTVIRSQDVRQTGSFGNTTFPFLPHTSSTIIHPGRSYWLIYTDRLIGQSDINPNTDYWEMFGNKFFWTSEAVDFTEQSIAERNDIGIEEMGGQLPARIGLSPDAGSANPALKSQDPDQDLSGDFAIATKYLELSEARVITSLGIYLKKIVGEDINGSLSMSFDKMSKDLEVEQSIGSVQITAEVAQAVLDDGAYVLVEIPLDEPVLADVGLYRFRVEGEFKDTTTSTTTTLTRTLSGYAVQAAAQPVFQGITAVGGGNGGTNIGYVKLPPNRNTNVEVPIYDVDTVTTVAETVEAVPVELMLKIGVLKLLSNGPSSVAGVDVWRLDLNANVPDGVQLACDVVCGTTRPDQAIEAACNRAGIADTYLDLAGTFATAGAFYGGTYKLRGAVTQQTKLRELLAQWAFESRVFLDWSGQKLKLNLLPAADLPPVSVRTIGYDKIRRDDPASPDPAIEIQRSEASEVINLLGLRWERDHTLSREEKSYAKARFLRSSASIGEHGAKGSADRFWFDFVRDEGHALGTGRAWLRWYYDQKRIPVVETHLDLLELEKDDRIDFDLRTYLLSVGSPPTGGGYGEGGYGEGGYGGAVPPAPATIIGEAFDGLVPGTVFLVQRPEIDFDEGKLVIVAREY